jgi:hypothetical protein
MRQPPPQIRLTLKSPSLSSGLGEYRRSGKEVTPSRKICTRLLPPSLWSRVGLVHPSLIHSSSLSEWMALPLWWSAEAEEAPLVRIRTSSLC